VIASADVTGHAGQVRVLERIKIMTKEIGCSSISALNCYVLRIDGGVLG
jgi:hypothetical protein